MVTVSGLSKAADLATKGFLSTLSKLTSAWSRPGWQRTALSGPDRRALLGNELKFSAPEHPCRLKWGIGGLLYGSVDSWLWALRESLQHARWRTQTRGPKCAFLKPLKGCSCWKRFVAYALELTTGRCASNNRQEVRLPHIGRVKLVSPGARLSLWSKHGSHVARMFSSDKSLCWKRSGFVVQDPSPVRGSTNSSATQDAGNHVARHPSCLMGHDCT